MGREISHPLQAMVDRIISLNCPNLDKGRGKVHLVVFSKMRNQGYVQRRLKERCFMMDGRNVNIWHYVGHTASNNKHSA